MSALMEFVGPRAGTGTRSVVRELWDELGVTMRMLREASQVSLRQVETETRVGRGSLSQYERGQAKPSRTVIEWYDENFGGDGYLPSLYAEARGAHGTSRPRRLGAVVHRDGDAAVAESSVALGQHVRPGARVEVVWTLRNIGTHTWEGRGLRRVGPRAAQRLLGTPAVADVPTCAPSAEVQVVVPVTVPSEAGTYAAYLQFVDADGALVGALPGLLPIVLLARASEI